MDDLQSAICGLVSAHARAQEHEWWTHALMHTHAADHRDVAVDVYIDSENCSVRRGVSASDAMHALHEVLLCALAHPHPHHAARTRHEGVTSADVTRTHVHMHVRVFHGKRHHRPEAASYRVFGAEVINTGTKQGSVDIAIKGALADALLYALVPPARVHELDSTATGSGREESLLSTNTFARTTALPVIVLVSGDADFADDVRRLRRVGYHVLLIHNDLASEDLKHLACMTLPWSVVMDAAEVVQILGIRRGATAAVGPHARRRSGAAHVDKDASMPAADVRRLATGETTARPSYASRTPSAAELMLGTRATTVYARSPLWPAELCDPRLLDPLILRTAPVAAATGPVTSTAHLLPRGAPPSEPPAAAEAPRGRQTSRGRRGKR